MTEAKWLRCTGPRKMLKFLGHKASQRKLRLFACACCRSVSHLFVDEWSPAAVETAERYADGSITVGRLTAAQRRIYRIIKLRMPNGSPQVYAANAAKCASIGLPFDAATAIETAEIAACALGKPTTRFGRTADAAERKVQCRLLSCIFGNPFRRKTAIIPTVHK